MDDISDVKLQKITESKYIRPVRVAYKQDGIEKTWDVMGCHDSVAILIHNISREVFVFVKQFRPAVYIARAEVKKEDGCMSIDTEANPGSLGVTHELCAGLVDKEASVEEIAQQEILEETGYQVALDSIQKITSFRSGVGISGSKQHLFYVEVTDQMKVSPGGGNPEEGELIELAEVPVKDSMAFALDEKIPKPVGMMFALMWFNSTKMAGEKL